MTDVPTRDGRVRGPHAGTWDWALQPWRARLARRALAELRAQLGPP